MFESRLGGLTPLFYDFASSSKLSNWIDTSILAHLRDLVWLSWHFKFWGVRSYGTPESRPVQGASIKPYQLCAWSALSAAPPTMFLSLVTSVCLTHTPLLYISLALCLCQVYYLQYLSNQASIYDECINANSHTFYDLVVQHKGKSPTLTQSLLSTG